MGISFTQRHEERRKKMADSMTPSSYSDIDEKWGVVAHSVPHPAFTCTHVWVRTNNTNTTCGKCRAKAVWDSVLLTFRLTGE